MNEGVAAMVTHRGGCHCGRVRFEVMAPRDIEAVDCNCSMCRRAGYLHLIVEADRFRWIQGRDAITEYRFNTGTARHLFCSVCGIKPFYVPRSHPDGWSVNVRCIDSATLGTVTVRPFDGDHWEASIDGLRGEAS